MATEISFLEGSFRRPLHTSPNSPKRESGKVTKAEMWLFPRDPRKKNQHSKNPLECGVYWFVLLKYAKSRAQGKSS